MRACYCRELSPVPTRTRVVLLQHPRERRVAIGTARIAHLGLSNSELHLGVDFSRDEAVRAVAEGRRGRAAVLYPVEGARPLETFRGELDALVVVDGTWTQAKKVLERNPVLASLPRVRLAPSRPGNYRIRKEPAAHCLSTVEAVVDALSQLEGEPERFGPLLRAFERMVDLQIACEAERTGPSRYKVHKPNRARPKVPPQISLAWDRLVVAYAEGNAPATDSPLRFDPELVHLAAERVATGERFEAIAAPRMPLSPGTPGFVGLPRDSLVKGEDAGAVARRFAEFVGEGTLATWGAHTLELLSGAGFAPSRRLDVRLWAARRVGRNPGGLDRAALRLSGTQPPPWAPGRAGLRVAALSQVLRALASPDAVEGAR